MQEDRGGGNTQHRVAAAQCSGKVCCINVPTTALLPRAFMSCVKAVLMCV